MIYDGDSTHLPICPEADRCGSHFKKLRLASSWLRMVSAFHIYRAPLAELVDAPDSKSGSERSAGSIPARGTNGFTEALIFSHFKALRVPRGTL